MSPYHHCWVPSSPTTTLGAWSRYLAGTWASNMSDRKSTRLNSSHRTISYAVFCLKKKNKPVQISFHGVGFFLCRYCRRLSCHKVVHKLYAQRQSNCRHDYHDVGSTQHRLCHLSNV